MTPKDKAEEMVSKYLWPQRAFNELAKRSVARECALLCVDEIINDSDASSPFEEQRLNYWVEVKPEIENL